MSLVPYQDIRQALACNDITIMQKGRKTCLAILKCSPDNLECLRLIANIDYQSGNFKQAEKWLSRALAIQPDAEIYFNYALTLVRQKKFIKAVAVYQCLAKLKPDQVEIFYYLGTIYEILGKASEAITAYQAALRLDPNNADILYQLGTVMMAGGDLLAAQKYFQHVLAINPQSIEALNDLGKITQLQGDFTQSIVLYKQALKIQPDYLPSMANLAVALDSAGLLAEAIGLFRQAIMLCPDSLNMHINLAMALLADGQMEEGWREFEKRTKLIDFFAARVKLKKPMWRGETGNGQTLLIRAEQGYGDTIQFCRYASLAAACGLRVVLEVQPPLVKLLQALTGVTDIIAYGDKIPKVDFYCPMMSMPYVFHTMLKTIPSEVPYLKVTENSRLEWQQRMPGNNLLKVGLVWNGKRRNASLELAAVDRRRSIDPSLLIPLQTIKDIQFYSLQKEGPKASAELDLIDMMDECHDFYDTAALIMNLDLVISVDTVVAHLAGALGKPVWLLNRFDCCWRWLKTGAVSPWYPTLRIFRQPSPGDWHSVITSVQEELLKWKKDRE